MVEFVEVYIVVMADLMIDIPDALLAEVDRLLSSIGSTRSEYFQSLIEDDLGAGEAPLEPLN